MLHNKELDSAENALTRVWLNSTSAERDFTLKPVSFPLYPSLGSCHSTPELSLSGRGCDSLETNPGGGSRGHEVGY